VSSSVPALFIRADVQRLSSAVAIPFALLPRTSLSWPGCERFVLVLCLDCACLIVRSSIFAAWSPPFRLDSLSTCHRFLGSLAYGSVYLRVWVICADVIYIPRVVLTIHPY